MTAELIFDEELKLYSPDFFIEEFMKYEDLILKKTNRTREKYIEILHSLKDVITTIPKEEFSRLIDKAEDISPDPKDVPHIALAMKLRCAIWSNDKKLKNQEIVKVYSTGDLVKKLP